MTGPGASILPHGYLARKSPIQFSRELFPPLVYSSEVVSPLSRCARSCNDRRPTTRPHPPSPAPLCLRLPCHCRAGFSFLTGTVRNKKEKKKRTAPGLLSSSRSLRSTSLRQSPPTTTRTTTPTTIRAARQGAAGLDVQGRRERTRKSSTPYAPIRPRFQRNLDPPRRLTWYYPSARRDEDAQHHQ